MKGLEMSIGVTTSIHLCNPDAYVNIYINMIYFSDWKIVNIVYRKSLKFSFV